MKILVISDSHGLHNNQELIEFENCDVNIHAGDSQLMYKDQDMQGFDVKIRGNCDFDNTYEVSELVEIIGHRIFVTHGHQYDVNFGLAHLLNEAKVNTAKIAVYGHTHVVNAVYEDNILILNPGSTRQSRSSYPKTYLILEIKADRYVVTIKDAESYTEIEQLEFIK